MPERGVLVSVRGGGHGVGGFAVCDEGLVIDLSPLKRISVDPAAPAAAPDPPDGPTFYHINNRREPSASHTQCNYKGGAMTLKLGESAPDFGAQTTTTDLFADIDRMDAHAFASRLSEGCRLRFGNAEPVAGRSAIEAAISGFFATIKGLSHDIVGQWDVDDNTIIESEVTYTRLDERHVTVPVATICRRGDELIDDYRIFIDLAPVLAHEEATYEHCSRSRNQLGEEKFDVNAGDREAGATRGGRCLR